MARPARLVLDTNVWLDWLVFDDPQIAPLRAAREIGGVEVVIDADCREELRRVLGYTFRKSVLAAEVQAKALAECLRLTVPLVEPPEGTVLPPLPLCRDKDDQKFLVLARAARADYLLTKDRALLELARRKHAHIGFRILTPAAWLGDQEEKAA
jgi:putative PIN family toxin of toxin-antitoxin system